MLEVNDFDDSRPTDARTPDKVVARESINIPPGMLSQVVSAGGSGNLPANFSMVPIETPISFAGFHENVLREFGPFFQQMGMTVAAGGASSTLTDAKPAPAQRSGRRSRSRWCSLWDNPPGIHRGSIHRTEIKTHPQKSR